MRDKKFYTVKEWKKFKNNDYFDMQEMLTQRYDVILTDHKTRKEKITFILKKFNQRNFDKAMIQFNSFMKNFGNSVDQFTKEIDISKHKDKDLIWGKSHNSVPIWGSSNVNSQRQHEANLEKIWGKKN
jgi:hypothetical protein